MSMKRRREFLADVGRGMLIAAVGPALQGQFGCPVAQADDRRRARIRFGELEPLVNLMQETPPDRLLERLIVDHRGPRELERWTAAAALANVRAFGGGDYTGYHAFMALIPAYQMAQRLNGDQRMLPVLKVIYRNSSRIQSQNRSSTDGMLPLGAEHLVHTSGAHGEPEKLRDLIRAREMTGSEAELAALVHDDPKQALDRLQRAVQDEIDVHRVVLAWRSWSMLDLAGLNHAEHLLRQSVRYCVENEVRMHDRHGTPSPIRTLLPELMDDHRLADHAKAIETGRSLDTHQPPGDAWVEAFADQIWSGSREQAARAVASALAEGIHPEVIGEAISMAANQLVLRDPGRTPEQSGPGKPPGCVHGDSVGVHASDAANAWRNIARVVEPATGYAALIVSAYHTAGQSAAKSMAAPLHDDQAVPASASSAELVRQLKAAVESSNQHAAVAIAGALQHRDVPADQVFDALLPYAISEDGALHAEKYYRTAEEEFGATRPAFRWRQLKALARVTASEYGYPAPGYQQARELLGLG